MVVIISSDVLYKQGAREDCEMMDIFSPVREDYK